MISNTFEGSILSYMFGQVRRHSWTYELPPTTEDWDSSSHRRQRYRYIYFYYTATKCYAFSLVNNQYCIFRYTTTRTQILVYGQKQLSPQAFRLAKGFIKNQYRALFDSVCFLDYFLLSAVY